MKRDSLSWIIFSLAMVVIVAGIFLNPSTGSSQTAHPCDTTPASVQTVQVGQSFTFGWCHSWADTNGQPTTITEYRVYRNGAAFAVVAGTQAGAPNATGLRYASIQRTETVTGQVSWDVSAVNSAGEGVRGGPFVLTVSALPASLPPSSPTMGRIVVP